MNYPMDQPLELIGNIEDIPIAIDLEGYLKDWDYNNRIEASNLVLEANRQLVNTSTSKINTQPECQC